MDKLNEIFRRENELKIRESALFARHEDLQKKSSEIREHLFQIVVMLINERDALLKQIKFKEQLRAATTFQVSTGDDKPNPDHVRVKHGKKRNTRV